MFEKQHILDEIKRTAEENGGEPLGRGRFRKETGIRVSDWCGIYWSKWGDAQREAGYEASKLKEGYDKEWLIQQLISLIRELKKFPPGPEIRMKRRRTKDFPCENALDRGIGRTKSKKIQRILAYCANKNEYQDIVAICSEVADSPRGKPEYDSGESETEWGEVYLMKSGRSYKIGKTKNPVGKRQYEIGTKLPELPDVVHTISTDDIAGIENYWHQRFEKKRVRGEWFELSSSDVKAFKRRKFQ